MIKVVGNRVFIDSHLLLEVHPREVLLSMQELSSASSTDKLIAKRSKNSADEAKKIAAIIGATLRRYIWLGVN